MAGLIFAPLEPEWRPLPVKTEERGRSAGSRGRFGMLREAELGTKGIRNNKKVKKAKNWLSKTGCLDAYGWFG